MTEVQNIQTAKNMRSGINLEAIVTRMGDPRTVNLKSGGTVDVCDATIEDDTGNMSLTLWGSDIQQVNIGDRIRIGNAYTNTFKDQVSLTKGKYGTLEIV